MTYADVLKYLFELLPMYQRVGSSAIKKDLSNTLQLCEHLRSPQMSYSSIHVGGTNGKGSSAHSIAAVLQAAGYKTGLYTSPHLKDFSERIRVNGRPIPEENVIDFVEKHRQFLERLKPSFFEMTVGLAFQHFEEEKVDIAVIEVGLGGRLDSTNVITPVVSLITNIGLDHTDMLGETLTEIAYEKAGIIKPGVPIVIGNHTDETLTVFKNKAHQTRSPIVLASQLYRVEPEVLTDTYQQFSVYRQNLRYYNHLRLSLLGSYQRKNIPGILATLDNLPKNSFKITEQDIRKGLQNVRELTGLKGRWQVLSVAPIIVADTGHNSEAFREIVNQISQYSFRQLHLVLGFVQGKPVKDIFELLPKNAKYYFCEPNVPRAMSVDIISSVADKFDLDYIVVPKVNDALDIATNETREDDFIFVGGSSFVVAELETL